jgi:hypothetical protein
MKKLLLMLLVISCFNYSNAQITQLSPENFKAINIGYNNVGDYTKSLILLHEVYNGERIAKNYAIGEVCALRGSQGSNNRTNIAYVNTSSGYQHIAGGVTGYNSDGSWKPKLAIYNGKKYIALDVPYRPDYHSSGFRFKGWTYSTAENMKWIAYENRGNPINTDILQVIGDFTPNMSEYHNYSNSLFSGNVVIGSETLSSYPLSVNGTIRAKEIKVETGWADFVFEDDYQLMKLSDLEEFINENGHLPEIPTEKEVEENGVSLGEMNSKLLQKIEELTLYIIDQNQKLEVEKKRNSQLQETQLQILQVLQSQSKEIEQLKEQLNQ